MKRILSFAVIAFAVAYMYFGTGAKAVTLTTAEKFAANGAIQTGESGVYNFDKAHSFIGFKVKHMGLIEVPGFFRDFTGTVNYDAKDPAKSSVEFTAKATSVDTGVGGSDNHLRSEDFFEVEKSGNGWMVTGDFTMKGVTKSISFPFNIAGFLPADQRSGGKIGVTAQTTLNRRDYGVNYGGNMPNGTAVLSDEVKIDLQIEANRPRPTPAASPASE